jgi:phage shock protein C
VAIRAVTEARPAAGRDAGYMTQMPLYKQLRRSRSDRMLAGVCGGIARYFAVDPVLVRVAFVLIAFLSGGTALLAYLIAWGVMPEETTA